MPLAAARSAKRVPLVLEHANAEQAEVFNNITNALEQGNPAMVFLDSPGGSGNNSIVSGLLHHYNRLYINFLLAASSGIAALLLFQGQSSHTAFKIPLYVFSNSMCSFSVR